ncbi:DUF975 family protein [Companilactobacillus metriopterae]|uniref:DUF975 family protein n=1 Tax=Companilactobacillus metriopterae TaxID=1909267 RepID=UPI0013E908EE|nr:DUF975 family protein [Companilactobacillus metriopterae]
MERHYKSRAELKQDVKNMYKGNWLYTILLNIIPGMIVLGAIRIIEVVFLPISILISEPVNNGQPLAVIIFILICVVNFIIVTIGMMLVSYGVMFTLLGWLRGEKINMDSVFNSGFSGFSPKYVKGNIIIGIESSLYFYLWSLLLVVPGIIKMISYSQAIYLYKDYIDEGNKKEYNFGDFITESRKLMDGHKWEYFVLQLSFLGWFLLSILTLGIGFIWLTPYINATNANFYDNLKSKKIN